MLRHCAVLKNQDLLRHKVRALPCGRRAIRDQYSASAHMEFSGDARGSNAKPTRMAWAGFFITGPIQATSGTLVGSKFGDYDEHH